MLTSCDFHKTSGELRLTTVTVACEPPEPPTVEVTVMVDGVQLELVDVKDDRAEAMD